jgi:hypothetical protein
MSDARFGETVELPWWVVALSLPPLFLSVFAVLFPASLIVKAIGAVPGVALTWIIVRVAMRVNSQNMQSVWISLAYGVWAIFPIVYVTALIAKH